MGKEDDLRRAILSAWELFGSVDMYFSNAGIFGPFGGVNEKEVSNEVWETMWRVNVMSHVYAARHLFPLWKANKVTGTFVITASAAGLLMQIGALPYHVTKHAALSIADWLAVEHNDDGVSVHCLCPELVRTNMMTLSSSAFSKGGKKGDAPGGLDGIKEPKDVAIATVNAIDAGTFLVLPHPQVKKYFAGKATDYDRWIKGMRRFKRRFSGLMLTNAPPPLSKL